MNKMPNEPKDNGPQTSELWRLLGRTEDAGPVARKPISPFWSKSWFRLIASVLIILMPLNGYLIYTVLSTSHRPVTVAIGPEGGRHWEIGRGVAQRIRRLNLAKVKPYPHPSKGSLENVRRMQIGELDFAIYQSGTEDILGEQEFLRLDRNRPKRTLTIDELPDYWPNKQAALDELDENGDGLQVDEFRNVSHMRFVANLFMEVVHVIVRNDSGIATVDDLTGRRVSVGESTSGNSAMSIVVLEHVGIDPDQIEAVSVAYEEMHERLTTDDAETRIDAAILTTGLGAWFVNKIMSTGNCRLLPIPRCDTLCMRRVFCSRAEIPAGLYRGSDGSYVPAEPIQTVGVQAELLVHETVRPHLVRQVTRSILSDDFLKDHALHELYRKDPESRRRTAQAKPDFAVHMGAGDFYDPHEFDAGAFERWEAMYSLIASAVIAGVFGIRWLIRRSNRKRGHRLDVYLNKLLKIELRQAALDSHPDQDDTRQLQTMLHEITALRQQALGEFSAHELNEDPAQYCFLEMCHYISEKIDAKLLRQRLDRRFLELGEEGGAVSPVPGE